MSEIKVQKVKLGDVSFMIDTQIKEICSLIKDSYLQEADMLSEDNNLDAEFCRGKAFAYDYAIKSLSILQSQMNNLLK
tara:strand:- start:12834 stop:13067 length:234 start_codon:yes stop_codon:yes gene_type:complete